MGNSTCHGSDQQLRHRRVNRRRFVQGAAGLGLAASGITAPRVITPARAQDAAPVTFWTTHTEPDLLALQQIVDNFNGQSTDFQVELVQIPPAQVTDVTTLMTAVRGGTGPDVYFLDRFIVAQRAADGLLQDLSQFAEGEDLLADNIGFARAEATFDGKPYALPFDTDVRALYYNRTMLQSVGVDPAEFDAANGPVTLDRVKEVAFSLNQTDANGNFTQMGFIPWYSQGWHYTYGFAFGGSFFDEAACEVTPDDPEIVSAFQWVYDYAAELDPQKVSTFIGEAMQPGFPPQQNLFTTGRVAMMVVGDWHIAQMERYAPDLDYGITYIPVPTEGGEPSTWAGGWSVVIPQGAKNPEQAFQFMQYFSGPDGQRVYTTETKHLPTLLSLQEEADLFSERHRFFAEQLLPITQSRPPIPVGALYWDALTEAWQKTYLNEEEPETALTTAKERVQPQLEQFCPVTIEDGTT